MKDLRVSGSPLAKPRDVGSNARAQRMCATPILPGHYAVLEQSTFRWRPSRT